MNPPPSQSAHRTRSSPPKTFMFPESSDFHADWLDRLRSSLSLRRCFGRIALQTVLVWLAWNGSNVLCAENFIGSAPAEGDHAASIDASSATFSDLWWRSQSDREPHPPSLRKLLNLPARRTSWLSGNLKLVADDDEPDDSDTFPPEPNIADPGPDMGDYPNSAYTLPKGRSYVEFAPVSFQTANSTLHAAYNFPFLLRYGITDDVELRLIGNGITSVFAEGNTVSGFSPLLIDSKVHLWDADMERYIPAASLEVYIQTNLATEAFQSGVQPSLNLNLDFPVNDRTNIEMTVGYTSVQDVLQVFAGTRFDEVLGHDVAVVKPTNTYSQEFSYQWAVEFEATEELEIFIHGYYNGEVFLQSRPGAVVGAGWFYMVSSRIMLFSSYNFGVDSGASPFSTQLGMAFAL